MKVYIIIVEVFKILVNGRIKYRTEHELIGHGAKEAMKEISYISFI